MECQKVKGIYELRCTGEVCRGSREIKQLSSLMSDDLMGLSKIADQSGLQLNGEVYLCDFAKINHIIARLQIRQNELMYAVNTANQVAGLCARPRFNVRQWSS
jgi:hypothetical protein